MWAEISWDFFHNYVNMGFTTYEFIAKQIVYKVIPSVFHTISRLTIVEKVSFNFVVEETYKKKLKIIIDFTTQHNFLSQTTMKIFQVVQKNFQWMGIRRDRISFGQFEWMRILLYVLSFTSPFIYTVHIAETSKQFMESILMVASEVIIFTIYLCFSYNSQTVYKMIDDLEQGINKSE